MKRKANDYFSYTKEGDLVITHLQCKQCDYYNHLDVLRCIKYPERKPIKVLRCKEKCPEFNMRD